MFKFFDTVLEFLGVIVDFFISFVTNTLTVLQYILMGMQTAAAVIFYMPAIVKAAALAIVSYAIIVNILNKGG